MGSWMAQGQRAATKKMGPCALRAWMGAASTVRMVLPKKGETVHVCVWFLCHRAFKELYKALNVALIFILSNTVAFPAADNVNEYVMRNFDT